MRVAQDQGLVLTAQRLEAVGSTKGTTQTPMTTGMGLNIFVHQARNAALMAVTRNPGIQRDMTTQAQMVIVSKRKES